MRFPLIGLALLFFVIMPLLPASGHFISPEWAQSPELPPCPADEYRIADCNKTNVDCSATPPCTLWRWEKTPDGKFQEIAPPVH